MKLSQFNDYLQTLATLGAVLGLLLVGYEVRQSNRIASSDLSSAIWSNWIESSTLSIYMPLSTSLYLTHRMCN